MNTYKMTSFDQALKSFPQMAARREIVLAEHLSHRLIAIGGDWVAIYIYMYCVRWSAIFWQFVGCLGVSEVLLRRKNVA